MLFDAIYKKMERELSERKKMMANVIEVYTQQIGVKRVAAPLRTKCSSCTFLSRRKFFQGISNRLLSDGQRNGDLKRVQGRFAFEPLVT